ncbi:hypothetical protein G9A89_010521 [Geosiphon pyriformis]|nr:hypothetical protein G9A89_010521 [Geosiphon pyriformis]
MQNDQGQQVDLYVPRKCSATNRLISAKDHAAVQINIGDVDPQGRYTGTFTTYALCGFIRGQGESDDSLNRLATNDGSFGALNVDSSIVAVKEMEGFKIPKKDEIELDSDVFKQYAPVGGSDQHGSLQALGYILQSSILLSIRTWLIKTKGLPFLRTSYQMILVEIDEEFLKDLSLV